MGKKGQVEMIETIMVLVVVVILIIVGIIFYFNSSASKIEETKSEICQLGSDTLLVAVTAMPEFQCSVSGRTYSDCIDIDKVSAFQNLLKDKNIHKQYDNFFSGPCAKTIRFELMYPEPQKADECQIGQEIGSCGKWTVFKPAIGGIGTIQSTPISLYSGGRYYIGRAVVEASS